MNSLVCCVFLMLWACGRAEGVACDFPEIENGRVSRWSYYTFKDQHFPMAKGRQIEYDCYEGFSTESGSTEDLITCSEDGWSPIPKCIRLCAISTSAVKNYEPIKVFTSNENVHYECEDGYKSPQNNLVDKAECTPTGWKPEQKCTEITCSLPNTIQHLRFISSETFKNGHVVKFNCEEGYKLIGANKIECYYFGWYPEPPRCEGSEEECPLPPVLANTIEEEMKPPYHSGDTVSYNCKSSYRLHGSKSITCMNGRWTSPPQCVEKEVCPRPPETPNGRILLTAHKALYHSDDIVVYTCDRGYRINGPSDIKCWLGRWPAAPACTAIACGAAPPVQDAAIVGPHKERYTSGERVTYTCQQGYAFENQSHVTCLDGQWTDPPVCEVTVCGGALAIEYAVIVSGQKLTYTSGERVIYECRQGYTFENQSYATCVHGQWMDIPICRTTACSAAPQVENADIVGQAKGIYTSGERVTYECHQGYAFEKHSHVTCLDSEWTEPPVCERGRCGPAPPILNGDIIGTREQSYSSGGFVEYKCAARHKMFGSSRVRCLNGDWSAIPECLGACQVDPDKLEEHNVELDIREGENVSFLEGETIRFTCIDGFRAPTPVSLSVRCTADGFKYPTCTDPHPCRILQEDMDGNNLELETKTDEVLYRNGEFIQFSCKPGFFETGPLSGICIESKIAFPTCIPPKGCPLLQERLDSFNIQLSPSYADKRYLVNGESVRFLCNHGFKIHRSSSSMLQECDNGIIVYPKCVKFIVVLQKEDK